MVEPDVGIGTREDGSGFDLVVPLRAGLPGIDVGKTRDLIARADGVCLHSHATRSNFRIAVAAA